jgi:hypothetical protein
MVRGTGQGYFNFNGGTLRALASVPVFIDVTTTTVNSGGAGQQQHRRAVLERFHQQPRRNDRRGDRRQQRRDTFEMFGTPAAIEYTLLTAASGLNTTYTVRNNYNYYVAPGDGTFPTPP